MGRAYGVPGIVITHTSNNVWAYVIRFLEELDDDELMNELDTLEEEFEV